MSSASPIRSYRRLVTAVAAVLAALWLAALAGPAAAAPAGDPTQHFNWTDLGYKSKDIAGGALEKDEPPMSAPMVVMLINFGIVLAIIGWKVAPPVQTYVRKRHYSIKEALDEAARLRADAKAKLDEYDSRLGKAEAEVDTLIAGIRADAEAEKKRIIASAEAQAAAMKRDAEARIAAEIARARLELEREVIAAAVAAAETMIRSKASSDDHVKLIDSFISDVQAQASAAKQERA